FTIYPRFVEKNTRRTPGNTGVRRLQRHRNTPASRARRGGRCDSTWSPSRPGTPACDDGRAPETASGGLPGPRSAGRTGRGRAARVWEAPTRLVLVLDRGTGLPLGLGQPRRRGTPGALFGPSSSSPPLRPATWAGRGAGQGQDGGSYRAIAGLPCSGCWAPDLDASAPAGAWGFPACCFGTVTSPV